MNTPQPTHSTQDLIQQTQGLIPVVICGWRDASPLGYQRLDSGYIGCLNGLGSEIMTCLLRTSKSP